MTVNNFVYYANQELVIALSIILALILEQLAKRVIKRNRKYHV